MPRLDVRVAVVVGGFLIPLQRHVPTGWDVANAAGFLASDEAGFITGASLPVDGGTLARIGF